MAINPNPPRSLCLRACRCLGLTFFESDPIYLPVPEERDLSPPTPSHWLVLQSCWRVEDPRAHVGATSSPQVASKSAQDASKSAMIASQMPFKRLSDAFSVDDAIWNPFWTRFWRPKGPLRHEKIMKIRRAVVEKQDFANFS